jgi:hypothetical protein
LVHGLLVHRHGAGERERCGPRHWRSPAKRDLATEVFLSADARQVFRASPERRTSTLYRGLRPSDVGWCVASEHRRRYMLSCEHLQDDPLRNVPDAFDRSLKGRAALAGTFGLFIGRNKKNCSEVNSSRTAAGSLRKRKPASAQIDSALLGREAR